MERCADMASKKSSDATNAYNMRSYKPRRPNMTMDDVVTPEIRAKRAEMVQSAKDEAATKSANEAYDKAMPTPEKYAKGGSVSKRADGCCIKGKTKGKML